MEQCHFKVLSLHPPGPLSGINPLSDVFIDREIELTVGLLELEPGDSSAGERFTGVMIGEQGGFFDQPRAGYPLSRLAYHTFWLHNMHVLNSSCQDPLQFFYRDCIYCSCFLQVLIFSVGGRPGYCPMVIFHKVYTIMLLML